MADGSEISPLSQVAKATAAHGAQILTGKRFGVQHGGTHSLVGVDPIVNVFVRRIVRDLGIDEDPQPIRGSIPAVAR